MKSKEDIEKLADIYGTSKDAYDREYISIVQRNSFIDAYTQCQEDMADIIKQAIEYGYQLRNNHKPINSGIDWVKEFNLLTKQDNENYTEEDMRSNDGTKDLYSKIENLIIIWNIDGTKTAGTLTRQIIEVLKK